MRVSGGGEGGLAGGIWVVGCEVMVEEEVVGGREREGGVETAALSRMRSRAVKICRDGGTVQAAALWPALLGRGGIA